MFACVRVCVIDIGIDISEIEVLDLELVWAGSDSKDRVREKVTTLVSMTGLRTALN